MTLTINGKLMDLPNTINYISDLLLHLGIEKKIAIVELNHKIIDKSVHAEQALTNGDRVEIVHFIGGG